MSDGIKTGSRRYYMHISVRGALMDLSKSRAKGSYWNDDNGKPLTRLQAIDALQDELVKGREKLPLGQDCANPCKHADKGCTGFDYGKNGGCPGYLIKDEKAVA